MVKVYNTAQGWCCDSADAVTYHNHLQGAMDAAYGKAANPASLEYRDQKRDNG